MQDCCGLCYPARLSVPVWWNTSFSPMSFVGLQAHSPTVPDSLQPRSSTQHTLTSSPPRQPRAAAGTWRGAEPPRAQRWHRSGRQGCNPRGSPCKESTGLSSYTSTLPTLACNLCSSGKTPPSPPPTGAYAAAGGHPSRALPAGASLQHKGTTPSGPQALGCRGWTAAPRPPFPAGQGRAQ